MMSPMKFDQEGPEVPPVLQGVTPDHFIDAGRNPLDENRSPSFILF